MVIKKKLTDGQLNYIFDLLVEAVEVAHYDKLIDHIEALKGHIEYLTSTLTLTRSEPQPGPNQTRPGTSPKGWVASTKKTKFCPTHDQGRGMEMPLSEFSPDRTKPDGVTNSCKACRRSYNKQYYKTHKETMIERAIKNRRIRLNKGGKQNNVK